MRLKRLIAMANILDSVGLFKQADDFDSFIVKAELISSFSMPDFSWLNQGYHLNNLNRGIKAKLGPKIDYIDEIIEANSDTLAKFDVKKYVGHGSYQDVWELDDGRILKITRDAQSYDRAIALENKLHSQENDKPTMVHDPMIYDHGIFELPSIAYTPGAEIAAYPLFWYIMEGIQTADNIVETYFNEKNRPQSSDTISDIASSKKMAYKHQLMLDKIAKAIHSAIMSYGYDRYSDYRLVFDDAISDISVFDSLSSYIKYFIEKDLDLRDDLIRLNKVFQSSPEWFNQLIKAILQQLNHGYSDLHSGNVGVRRNSPTWVFYDT